MDHQFISNRDIVMFSFQSWDTEIGSNFKDMAVELAKKNRVLFVNRALDRSSLRKNKNSAATQTRLASIKNGTGELTEVMPNIWVHNPRIILASINGIPFAAVHDWFNKINSRRLAAEINKVIAGIGLKDVILINDNDFIRGFYLKDLIPCSGYIFYIRDYMLGVDFFKRHGQRLESGTMQKADLVVANSIYLANYAKKNNPNSFYIGQGCDFEPFLQVADNKPADLKTISGPIIGYTGFVSVWRIDTAILRHIAEQFPAYNIVLVGPVDPLFDQSSLSHLPNVHFLGGKTPAALPAYIQHFDVCINPQIVNEVTIGNYPRKADEYLAMGKPLVATATDAMQMFAPYCFLCSSKEAFAEKIDYIIKHPSITNSETIKQSRKAFALSHTWQESIGLLGDAWHTVNKKTANEAAITF